MFSHVPPTQVPLSSLKAWTIVLSVSNRDVKVSQPISHGLAHHGLS